MTSHTENHCQARRHVRSASPWEDLIGFSRAVRVGDTIHVAGSGPVWPDGSFDPDPHVQAARCFAIGAAALAELGASLDDVVRTRMFVTSDAVIDAVGRAHHAAVGHVAPAATLVIVAGLDDPRWVVEVELDAVVR